MLTTKRKPPTIGEILIEEFMRPMGLTQGALAEAMGVQRKHVNELCNDRRQVTAPATLILARAFGTSPDFWLNVQRAASATCLKVRDFNKARIPLTTKASGNILIFPSAPFDSDSLV